MKKLLIRALIAIVLSIGLVTNSVNIAYADEKVAVPDYPCAPDDSSSFYQCAPNGELIIMQCPAGLTFDVAANRCEYSSSPFNY